MAKIEKTVFISYRRDDVYTALAVYQDLNGKGYDVFFDYTSIHSGDFEQIIVSNIKARAHFVLILTPTSLNRCSEPGDWVRREIEIAIDEKRNIVPLFFKGFSFGSPAVAEKLTGTLKGLNRYNGLNVHEDYFKAAMSRLSDQFLNVPLDTIIHPIPAEVQRVVEKEQRAADDALVNEKTKIDNVLVSSKSLKGGINLKLVGGGIGILLVLVIGIFGVRSLFNNRTQAETSTPPPAEVVVDEPIPTNTAAAALIDEPVAPPTNTPVVGRAMILSPKDKMKLLYINAGEFEMGSDLGVYDEEPIHTVYLDSYWIDETEVTNEMYADCVAEGACDAPLSVYYADEGYADHPVQDVKWDDANNYCSWAGRRLPTEAEWEKAASWNERTGEKYIYPWGDEFDGTLVNFCDANCAAFEWADTDFNDGYGATAPAGSYSLGASPYGALDMAGNVWEWVADFYSDSYYAESDDYNPTGPTSGSDHVLRGGSWASGYNVLTTTYRNRDTALVNFGFRCAMDAQ